MKVLLTAINAKYIHSNLAVYSLRAYAGKYAQQTEIAEYTINQTMDDILSDIYRKKPDILCLSCYLWNILYVEQLITEISKVLPGTQIWLGGPEVSYNAVSVMEQYPQVTGVMCGEGEDLSGTDGILESGEGKSGYDQGYRIPGEWNLPAEPAAPGHGSE